jgi:hypothetical protein
MEELVEEILLRIPPDEPAHLVRATLVCKPVRRILSDPGFLRRYRTLHRAPPLLGYFYDFCHRNPGRIAVFISTTAASSPLFPLPPALDRSSLRVHDCRHGRVLIEAPGGRLIVRDPITGDQKKLSVPTKQALGPRVCAVLCAVDGCDHLDCHAGPFLVVYCGTNHANKPFKTWATMYSSETREWSALISIDVNRCLDARPTRLIRNALYFSHDYGVGMVKYDLIRHELSVISSPGVRGAVAMELDDGALGFVAMLDRCIYRWSWQADANNGIGKWAEHMVMQLDTLLTKGNPNFFYRVVGFVEGTDTIFISAYAGLFTLDLKSKKVKKIGRKGDYYRVIPYMSFYTRGTKPLCFFKQKHVYVY